MIFILKFVENCLQYHDIHIFPYGWKLVLIQRGFVGFEAIHWQRILKFMNQLILKKLMYNHWITNTFITIGIVIFPINKHGIWNF